MPDYFSESKNNQAIMLSYDLYSGEQDHNGEDQNSTEYFVHSQSPGVSPILANHFRACD